MKRLDVVLLGLLLVIPAAPAASPAEPGPAVSVAPDVEKSIWQTWPKAAWSAEAKCWLVVWREGDLTGENCNVWCARVSADGKSLDPKGIRVSATERMQDRPTVASDGKDFLVVWEDLRSGKGYDVYAARVSGDGKVLDPDGVLVAGGEENQCRPSAAFAKGSYLVAWMGHVGGAPGYVIFCTRLSTEGKPLGQKPVALSPENPDQLAVWHPSVAAGDEAALVVATMRGTRRYYYAPLLMAAAVAMPGGRPEKPMAGIGSASAFFLGYRTASQPAGAVWTGKAFLVAFPTSGAGKGPDAKRLKGGTDAVMVVRMDGKGVEVGGEPAFAIFADKRLKRNPCVSIAFDGRRCLLTEDVAVSDTRIQVRGCFLSPEGKPLEGEKITFPVAGDEKREAMQGFAAAGPEGSFLVVWSEPRGVDDVKVMARIVKP